MHEQLTEQLAARLRKHLADAKATLGEVSRQTGISKGQLSGWLAGNRGLGAPSINALAAYLRVRIC